MVLIIQEPRAHQPEGQEIVPFEDLVDFGDGEKNVAFLIKKTYEKKAHRGKANLIQAPEKFGKAIRMQAELASAFALTISSTRPCEHARWRLQMGTLDVNARADAR